MKPLVTVFTLIYNTNPRYVIEAIEAVRANNYPNLQHIIIDDCSPDPSPRNTIQAWIKSNNYNCEFYVNEKNLGVCKTLNKVLSLSKGKYLIGCSDDLITPDRINTEVELFESLDESYGIVFGLTQTMDQNGELQAQVRPLLGRISDNDYFRHLIKENFISAPSVTMKTSALMELGGFDESLILEDYDMWLRLAYSGYRFKLQPRINSYHRVHSGGLSSNPKVEIDSIKVRLKFFKESGVKAIVERRIKQYFFERKFDILDNVLPLYTEAYGFRFIYWVYSSALPYSLKKVLHYSDRGSKKLWSVIAGGTRIAN